MLEGEKLPSDVQHTMPVFVYVPSHIHRARWLVAGAVLGFSLHDVELFRVDLQIFGVDVFFSLS